MKFNDELIQLGKSIFHNKYHKELLKQAFRDGIYNTHRYRGIHFNRFLEEKGYFVKEYSWYVLWYQTFLEASYSKPYIMEKKIITLFTSLPLNEEGVTIFNDLFYYYDNHIFGEFWYKIAKNPVLDEFFIYCTNFSHYYVCSEMSIEILSLLRQYEPYISNYGKWRKLVDYKIQEKRTIY